VESITALEKEEALAPHHGNDADIAAVTHTGPARVDEDHHNEGGLESAVDGADSCAPQGTCGNTDDDEARLRVPSVAERLHQRMEEMYAQIDQSSA
jgi:hypothetical protein